MLGVTLWCEQPLQRSHSVTTSDGPVADRACPGMEPNALSLTGQAGVPQEFDHSPLMSRGTSRDYQSVADQSSFAGVFTRGASRDYVDSIGERWPAP